jgi:hypothetical protein
LAKDYVGMVNRVIWLTFQKGDDFIDTPLKEERFANCLEFHKKFLESGEEKPATPATESA